MAIFGPKPWPKCQFFHFLNFLFLQPRKAFFSFQNIVKDMFLVYIAPKKNVGKKAIFGPKPRVNLFRKMSIFRLFELLLFIPQKGIFFVLEYRTKHFPGLYCLKKKVEKMAIFGPKPLLNPLRKMSNFRVFELLVFIAQKAISFVLEYRKRHVHGLYSPKKKVRKMAIFGPKPWLNHFRKMSIFRLL